MRLCGIYGIRNMVNGKWYVGQSTNIKKRWILHRHLLRSNKHYNRHLLSAFNKYGEDCFEFRMLDEVPELLLDLYEGSWITQLRADNPSRGYNLCLGGSRNKHHSVETRLRISGALVGRIDSAVTHKRKSEGALAYWKNLAGEEKDKRLALISRVAASRRGRPGRPHSDTTRKKIGAANVGKHFATPATRKKMSVSRLGVGWSAGRRERHEKKLEKKLT